MVHLCKMMISPGVFSIFFLILIFLVVRREKEQNWFNMTKKSVCHTSYLRNHTYDGYLWHNCIKWWYIWEFLTFFQNFGFLGCWGDKKVKLIQNGKNFVCRATYLTNRASYNHYVGRKCKMMVSPDGFFFHFFIILIFWVISWVKGQKLVQSDKKFWCAPHLRNHTSRSRHLWCTSVTWWYRQVCFFNSSFPGC